LEELAVHYRITDGTILGLYRDKRFIPHDTDIDIDILDCADQAKVHRCMRSFGMHLGRRAIIYGKIQQAAYFSDDYIIFDINYWYRDGDRVVNYSEPGYLREQPADYFSELGTLQWNGRTYPVPGKLEEWLAFRYGKDWKIPKRSKVDWKQECFDLVRLD
jgi:phosphorylcholine metabolism protein LicD